MAKSSVTLNSGSGGAVIVTDEISVEHYQVVKQAFGAFGTATPVTTSAPLPVDIRASNASQAVTNAGTFATQIDGDALTALQLIDNIVQVEDAVHGSGDSGVMALAVRNDVLAALAGADGDYAPLQVNASGALFVQEGAALDVSAATVTVDNAGTFATQVDGAALTALQLIDDPVFTDDAAFTLATSKVSVSGAIRDDVLSALAAIEGDVVPLRVSSTGALHVTGGSAGTEFNEDDASSGGEAGSVILGVRRDADTTPVSADGDFHNLIFDAQGCLKQSPCSLVSVNNSSTAALGSSASFTGTADNIHTYALSVVNFHAEPSNADGTLFIEFSSNGTDWDRSISYSVSDPTAEPPHTVIPVAEFFRVRYVNGTTAQTALRLQTLHHGTKSKGLTSRADQTITDNTDVDNVRAIIVGKSGSGNYINLKISNGGSAQFNLEEIAETAVDVNTGNASAGTMRVVLASDQPVVSIDDNAGSLTVDNAGTFATQIDGAALTALQLIDDPIFVDDAAFTLTSSSVSVAGAIRDDALSALAAAEGDAVPLRVSSIGALHVTGGGGGTEFAEDAAHTTGDLGSMALGVRQDADTTPVSADGDYHSLIFDALGNLKVNIKAGSASGTEFNEDTAHTTGDAGPQILGVRRDADTTPVSADGDYHTLIFNDAGALKVEIFDSGDSHTIDGTVTANAGTGTFTVTDDGSFTLAANSGVDIGDITINNAAGASAVNIQDGGNSITVDGTITANLSATDNAVLDQIELNTSYGDNVGNGTAASSLRVTIASDTTGVLSVDDNGGSITVDGTVTANAGTGTFTVTDDGSFTLAANSGVDIGDVDVISVTPGTAASNLGKAEDAGHATGDVGVMSLAVRQAADTPLSGADLDYEPLQTDASGFLKVNVKAGSAGGTEFAEDTVHTTGDAGTMALVVRNDTLASLVSTDGDYAPLQVNASGALFVQQGAALDVSGATVTVDLGANNDVTIDNSSIVNAEDAVHGSGDSGVMALGVRNDDLAALAGTDGDYAPFQLTENGALLSCPAANDAYLYEVIDDATSGDNTLIAAVASRRIRVVALFMIAAGTVNVRFEDGAAGTALTGQMNLVVNSGFSLPYNPAGWFETSVNTLLNLELSAAISVDGSITYILVP